MAENTEVWQCKCGNSNPSQSRNCIKPQCKEPRPNQQDNIGIPIWKCLKCGKATDTEICIECTDQKWECSRCKKANFLTKKRCECGTKLTILSNSVTGVSMKSITRTVSDTSMMDQDMRRMSISDDQSWRILLVGIIGAGKSSFANSIAGRSVLRASSSFRSVTEEPMYVQCTRNNKEIHVFDTPGLIGSNLEQCVKDNSSKIRNILDAYQNCFWSTSPGVHVIAVVINCGRFLDEHHSVIHNILKIFGEDSKKFIIFVFTRVDELKIPLQSAIDDGDERLKKWLKKCDNNYIGINNTLKGYHSDQQIDGFIAKVDETFKRNKCTYYTNEIYQKAYEALVNMAKTENKTENEIRTKIPDQSFISRFVQWFTGLFK